MTMRGIITGVLYCALWYGSIVAGFLFIACPMIPLLIINPPKFRKCGDLLFSHWELYPTALMRFFGTKILVSGDHISPEESAILVMNHRTRVDWNFLWGAMYQACLPSVARHKLKFILKDPIRHIPGPGWIMQMNGFIYITRRWEEDRKRFSRTLDYLISLRRRTQLLIFPEGTDLTKSSRAKSDKYALQHELPYYSHVLHPKTTGFNYLVQHLQEENALDAIYDLTIAYPDYVPQSEMDVLKGRFPKEVHFHVERISSSDIPKQESVLRSWLEKRWYNKEKMLDKFYENKRFTDDAWTTPKSKPLRFALVFWSVLTGAMVFLLLTSPAFQAWTALNSIFFITLSLLDTAFCQIEIQWYWRWKSLLNKIKRILFKHKETSL